MAKQSAFLSLLQKGFTAMRIKSPGHWVMVSVLAAALPLAAAVPMLLAPASASAATSKLAGREAAPIYLANVGAGVKVKIQGGGAGTSNCTSNETDETLTTGPGSTEFDVAFDTRGSGSCAVQPSWSYFTISVTGRNNAGTSYDASVRVRFGGNYFAGGDLHLTCESPVHRMSCRETSQRSIELAASPVSLGAAGTRKLGTPRSTELVLNNVSAGPQVAIRGGGAGTSNCTSDETSTSFTAAGGAIEQTLAFDSRGSGSCAIEPSFSYFKVSVKGHAADGAFYDSSANVRYGQTQFPTSSYGASCGESRYLIHMRCSVTKGQITLDAEPLR
jgi:hypothetical protein